MIGVRAADTGDAGWIERLLDEGWGGPEQVANGERYRPADLPGFVAELDGERVGYAALRVADGVAWIGLIESFRPREGIGTALVEALADAAREAGCETLRAITTNDNRSAQAFYERLGFTVREVRAGAVNESRIVKPAIPLFGEDGIAMTDEIEYEMGL
ncbi:MAG TPA: GNAT family N-acetyltransferase [Actinomycetota bacterium]|jgi:ribosomal protein S18 acetylase RimI-like enzyme